MKPPRTADAPDALTDPPHSPGFEPTPNPEGEMMWRSSPSRYIAKIHMETRKEVLRPIDPEDLLVHAHRDKNPMEVAAQFFASRAIQLTGNESFVRKGLRRINAAGTAVAETLGAATGSETVETQAKKLLGVGERDHFYRFRELTRLSEKELRERIEKLQKDAAALLRARGRNPKLVILLTGATGFLGKEILVQAASDRRVAHVVSVVRPKTIRDPKTKEVMKVLTPAQRGAALLRRLGMTGQKAAKFRFIGGDIEAPDLGIAPAEIVRLQKTVTHVIHCAASVAFDDTYENSYRANVLGSRNALEFALSLQSAKGSRFIQHIAIETSYIHGRKKRSIVQESALTFPRNFYNNFYELTKAMASIETDRFLVERGLRVSQLLPSIVIGHSRTGNNRGDTKVVNAPINAFGRAKEIIDRMRTDPVGRAKAWVVMAFALAFPSDRSAELNLVPVDRVVAGILAALTAPASIGERVHLATDNRLRAEDIVRICKEEIGIDIRLADPTLFRNVTLPVVKAALERMNQPKLANALSKLGTIFGGYGEWGQPVHDVGNDVRVLGLVLHRPSTEFAFRMLCRHNRFVQEFGQIRDEEEIARREAIWEKVIDRIELRTGRQIASIPADEFRRLMTQDLDVKTFRER